jgi:hypothetical protein
MVDCVLIGVRVRRKALFGAAWNLYKSEKRRLLVTNTLQTPWGCLYVSETKRSGRSGIKRSG